MSSNQQLNVHISIVNDLCETNDSQRDCDNAFDCFTNSNIENTLDDIITANIVLENEALKSCEVKHSQHTKNNGDETENLEANEYGTRSLTIGESVNFQSGEPIVALADKNEDGLERIVHSGENLRCEDNVICSRDSRHGVDSLNNDFTSLNDICSPIIGDGILLVPSNIVEQQIRSDVLTQPIVNDAQLNEKTSNNSNQLQTWSDNDEIQEADNKDTSFKKDETTNEPKVLAEDLPSISSITTNQLAKSSTNEPEVITEEIQSISSITTNPLAKSSTHEPEVLSEEPPNISSETTNQTAESSTEDPSAEGDKIENYTEGSNDENEILSNESDSNEDNNELPDIVDFDGINEVENDEYILDTVVRKPRKERRRIVSINDDDSDPEADVERERLLHSPTIEENKLSDNENAEDVDIEMLIQNEKPGPKSKKMSTQKLKELQTRALLRNAVVIPSSSCGKKKKSRIIDSDDEEENSLLPYCVDVDDIGIPDTTEDNDNEGDVLAESCILLNDIDKADTHPVECTKQDEIAEKNSICGMSTLTNQSKDIELTEHSKTEVMAINPDNINFPIKDYECCQDFQKQSKKKTQVPVKQKSAAITRNETALMCDSGNSTDSSNQQCRKGNDGDTAVVVQIPPFPSSSSSDDDDEFIPNDVYFGTPDVNSKRSSRGKGRPRGRPAQTTSRTIANSQNLERQTERGRGISRRGRPPRLEKFIDNRETPSTSDSPSTSSSESEDEYQKSKARRKPHTVTIVKAPTQLYHNVSLPIPSSHKHQPIQRQIRRKRDRFYDKSQDIPNAIYFGDVDVPLHVLHSYGDSDSDGEMKTNLNVKTGHVKSDHSKGNVIRFSSQVSRGRGRALPITTSHGQMHTEVRYQHNMPSFSSSQKTRGRPKSSSVSPSSDRSIQMMKKCLKAAGLKKIKLNRLWEGCKSNSERAAKMLELLREKGLEGEPTISKCRQLKVDYLTKKEIEDLDPNLIIQTEGRTRRSVTRAATKRQYTYDEDEILETRTKLSKVIDSDSDFD